MANLEKLKENRFTTKDITTLFLDNDKYDGHRKNMLTSVNAMDLKTEPSFSMQELMNGTESSQLLINQWHSVANTTTNLRDFYSTDVDAMLLNVQKSINDTAKEAADALNTDAMTKNLTLINKTASPFDDEGSYGGNQGSLFYNRSGFTIFGWRIFYDKDLYKFVKSYPQYKDYSVDDVYELYKNINQEGCGFVAMANSIFEQYEGREDEFEEIFGFPMYDKKTKDLNFDRLLIDIYAYTNDKIFMDQPNATYILTHSVLEYYEDKKDEFKEKFGIEYDDSSMDVKQAIIDYYAEEDVVEIETLGNTASSFKNRILGYAEYKGIDCEVSTEYNLTTDEIQEKIDQGYTITVGCFDFDMYDKNKKLYAEDVGGHYMTITGVTDDGYIEVSSWGEKYYIKSDDPGIDDYQIVKFE